MGYTKPGNSAVLTGKKLFWSGLVILVVVIGFLITRPRTGPRGYPADLPKWLFDPKQKNAHLLMENLEYTNNRQGRDEWVLHASFARYLKEDQKVYLDGVQINFFQEDGRTVTVSGEHATYATNSKDIDLWHKVSAITSDGERFYTEALTYNDEKRLFSTPEEVTSIGSKMDLKGKGLTYELATGKMSILKDVRVITQKSLK